MMTNIRQVEMTLLMSNYFIFQEKRIEKIVKQAFGFMLLSRSLAVSDNLIMSPDNFIPNGVKPKACF